MSAKYIRATFDLESQQVLLPHPTKEDVWVSVNHFQQLMSEEAAGFDQTCEYSTEERCIGVTRDKDGNLVPFGCKTVSVCRCN